MTKRVRKTAKAIIPLKLKAHGKTLLTELNSREEPLPGVIEAFENVDADRASEIVQHLFPTRGQVSFQNDLTAKAYCLDMIFGVLANTSTAEEVRNRFCKLVNRMALLSSNLQIKGSCADVCSTTESIVTGLRRHNSDLFTLIDTDASLRDTFKRPICVMSAAHLPDNPTTGDLVLSDLPGADLRDLHILNGHPETRCSIILCRAGYKFRFRIKQADSPNKYNCYQFPGGDKLMKFREGDDIQGRTLFVKLVALIILNNVEDKLDKKGSTLSALISKDAAVERKTILRNNTSNHEVTITSLDPNKLDASILKRARKSLAVKAEDLEQKRIDELMNS